MSVSIKDLMWAAPPMISPRATLKDAAKAMTDLGCGVLPVGIDGRVEGIITDRDIVVRAISKGKNADDEKIEDFMTTGLCFCKESDTIGKAANLMKKNDITRLVVTNNTNRFAGILSFGHIFRNDTSADEMAEIITRIANRHENNNQAAAV